MVSVACAEEGGGKGREGRGEKSGRASPQPVAEEEGREGRGGEEGRGEGKGRRVGVLALSQGQKRREGKGGERGGQKRGGDSPQPGAEEEGREGRVGGGGEGRGGCRRMAVLAHNQVQKKSAPMVARWRPMLIMTTDKKRKRVPT